MGFIPDLVQQLRQGVWSSFTGGWYYDPYHKIFTNTVHLYMWLFFFCFPFSIHLYLPPDSHYIWIYTGTIFLVFTLIKVWNRVLHNLFDTGEMHEVTEDLDIKQSQGGDSIELKDMSKSEYSDEWRMGVCVPSLRLPSINEEGGATTQSQTNRTAATTTAAGTATSRDFSTSSRFDLKVDVHSKPIVEGGVVGLRGGSETADEEMGGQTDVEVAQQTKDKWRVVPDEVIDINSSDKSDVVILVDEGNVQHSPPSVPLATVLEETKHPAGVSFDASNGEVSVSFSTTSSQLTMQGVPGGETTRRYSNISNLARSIRSEPGSNSLQPVTGSLEIMAILDPNLSQIGNRRSRNGNSRSGRNVRRTKSVLDAGLGCVAPMSMSSYPVSLDAGINQQHLSRFRSKPSMMQTLKALELKESQISEASEEGSLDPPGEPINSDDETKDQDEKESAYDKDIHDKTDPVESSKEDKEDHENKDVNEGNNKNKEVMVDTEVQKDNETSEEGGSSDKESTPTATTSKDISIQTDPRKYRILFLPGLNSAGRSPMKEGKVVDNDEDDVDGDVAAASLIRRTADIAISADDLQVQQLNQGIIDLMEEAASGSSSIMAGGKLEGGKSGYKWWDALRGPDDSSDEDKSNEALEAVDETESPKKKKMRESRESANTRSEQCKDVANTADSKDEGDFEVDLEAPQSFLSNLGIDWLFSDSEPDDATLNSPKQVPSADEGTRGSTRKKGNNDTSDKGSASQPGTSSTKAKSRDSSHGSSGTDTETRTLLNKLEEVEATLEAAGAGGAIPKRSHAPYYYSERRRQRQYELADGTTSSTTLQEDAEGLRKLFLEIFNQSETDNPDADLELKKLIQTKRDILESNRLQHQQPEPHRTRRRLAQRRKRRHAAEHQPEEQYPPSEPLPPQDNLEGMKVTSRVRRRRADRASTRPQSSMSPTVPVTSSATDNQSSDTHLAENHEDTTSGAVHYFQDEHGNWQTYTFGGETQTSTILTSEYDPADSRAAKSGESRSSSRVFPRSIFTGYPGTGEPGSRRPSRPLGGEEGTEASGGGYSANPNYTANSRSSSESGFTVILDSPAMVFRPSSVDRQRSQDSNSDNFWSTGSGNRDNGNSGRYNVNASAQAFRRHNPFTFFTENLLDRLPSAAINSTVPEMLPFSSDGSPFLSRLEEGTAGGRARGDVNMASNSGNLGSMHSNTPKIKKYHLLKIPGFNGFKIWLDRLEMLNILDQDESVMHTLLAIFLATLTAVLGSLVIQEGYCKDLWLLLFCLVLCSCQYSMLKSVQPDASSPTHGFNIVTVYSRPVYFIVFCSMALILDNTLKSEITPIRLYSIDWCNRHHLEVARDLIYIVLLAFPFIFTMGLLPQINTAAMFTMEQMDIQIFGGNAATSIQSSLYCIARSMLATLVLVGFAYGGLTEGAHSAHAQQVLFSIFCALAVSISYHLSRASGDPTVLLSILKRHFLAIISEESPTSPTNQANKPPASLKQTKVETEKGTASEEAPIVTAPLDPLPKKLRDTVNKRLTNDCIMILLLSIFVFLIVQSDVFEQGHPYIDMVLWLSALLTGLALHYLLPHMRKENPWKCLATPVLKCQEHSQFEVHKPAMVMWWEKMLVWAITVEKSVLYPAIFLSAVYQDKTVFLSLFGLAGGSLLMSICLLKCLRICYSDCSRQFLILLLSILIFQYNPLTRSLNNLDPTLTRSSPFLLDYVLTSILVTKLVELYLKCQFVITYAAPHLITWGSPFHAFAQPFSVPHSAMLFLQAAVSSALSSPLNPFLGSTIFLCSYARPVKFWERNYNTKRVDNSNTRLANQVEMRNPGADDNNLNSIFYEHLTRSLQHSLAGDIMLGRWGEVQQGDFFVLASDNLNCLVHIIELGNGLCTFQVRGLEFRGTYCHQQEVATISEGVEDNEGCCCFKPGHLPNMLSMNAAWSQRWLAWEVSAVKYVLEGYSISDNSAQTILQQFDFRKHLVSYYIKAIIYYTVRSPKLKDWLESDTIQEAIKNTTSKDFVDLDPLFNSNIDEDFDFRVSGITRSSFCNIYLSWIQFCAGSRSRTLGSGRDSDLVSLCLALSLLGRRALGAAGHNAISNREFFLVGLYSLFKGDFRITSVRDEWVFSDMELLRRVVAPAVRMSLKLHQDHFTYQDEYEDPAVLYDAITRHEKELVIAHEGDPAWRAAVLSGAQSLLALRHVVDDGSEEYKIIMLNKRFLSFRVIKLNRECVRGLWAGQQQELIFFRNRNPERGSIQNAKQVLRNIINSSCDQPLGYPIYVSPLTTSYTDTNDQITSVLGSALSLGVFKSAVQRCWERIWDKCAGSCSSGSRGVDCDINTGGECIIFPESIRAGSLPANRSSLVSSVSKPSTVSLAGLLGTSQHQSIIGTQQGTPTTGNTPTSNQRLSKDDTVTATNTPNLIKMKKRASAPQLPVARIIDPLMVYDNINLGRRIDPIWPEQEWRAKGGRNAWNNWIPMEEMRGFVLHRWTPQHPLPMHRSHTDKTILLLKIEDKYVPIAEHAVEIIYQDCNESSGSPYEQTKLSHIKSSAKDADHESSRSPKHQDPDFSRSPSKQSEKDHDVMRPSPRNSRASPRNSRSSPIEGRASPRSSRRGSPRNSRVSPRNSRSSVNMDYEHSARKNSPRRDFSNHLYQVEATPKYFNIVAAKLPTPPPIPELFKLPTSTSSTSHSTFTDRLPTPPSSQSTITDRLPTPPPPPTSPSSSLALDRLPTPPPPPTSPSLPSSPLHMPTPVSDTEMRLPTTLPLLTSPRHGMESPIPFISSPLTEPSLPTSPESSATARLPTPPPDPTKDDTRRKSSEKEDIELQERKKKNE